ncbi:pilus assembly protein TadG-related protein [Paenibacillus sp. BSR1-1]|uniref:TadE/TadG family type IV pilus assembly protein n=1 Tax=Paenibacillus sp. BSR1-1 TaxID=3020845 RepID=UPI0025B26AA1|nr:TadE/TadG family type IV pilus assembly protein [Paenibacillus sp. BSR1-1]MDN3019726.1 pilus assembly protein TadG-related protein [Paenibacillus sp. BSR1-1]
MKRILFKLLNLRKESGSALVIVAISMVALLGFTALVIDGGRLYSEKSKLQKAMDATVLAGAQGLRSSEAHAISIAKDISQNNGFAITESNLTITSDSIKATKQVNVPMTFAKAIGINDVSVSAKAKAIIAPLKKAKGIAPLAIEQDQVPTATILNCGKTNPGTNHGNCGYLDFGNGADGLANAFLNGASYEVGTKIVETEPGGKQGKVQDAINTLIANDAGKSQCQSASTADNSCDRVVTIVVIDSWDGANGKSTLNVVGLASYWLEKYEDKKLYGQFIKMVSPGEIGSSTAIGDYNLFGVKLVE